VAIRQEARVGEINLEVWDATGNKRLNVRLPDDVVVERILMVLADKLHLPRHAPDGQLMSYKFHHRRLGTQLLDDQTLAQQQVQSDDVVRIQPEITAGARPAQPAQPARPAQLSGSLPRPIAANRPARR
jgi:WXG100 protein secretion system (Wss), protein YukD